MLVNLLTKPSTFLLLCQLYCNLVSIKKGICRFSRNATTTTFGNLVLPRPWCCPLHPLHGAPRPLPVPYVPCMWVTRGALLAQWFNLCASCQQKLAVPQEIYSPISISVERSCRPCIRWCGTVGF